MLIKLISQKIQINKSIKVTEKKKKGKLKDKIDEVDRNMKGKKERRNLPVIDRSLAKFLVVLFYRSERKRKRGVFVIEEVFYMVSKGSPSALIN